MHEITYPRSPREMMAGWIYLPRYIDQIRPHLAWCDEVKTFVDLIDVDEKRI